MKSYPYEIFRTMDGTEFVIPTEDAVKNFESYLDEDELLEYSQLSEGQKLMISVSVNPFSCFIRKLYV